MKNRRSFPRWQRSELVTHRIDRGSRSACNEDEAWDFATDRGTDLLGFTHPERQSEANPEAVTGTGTALLHPAIMSRHALTRILTSYAEDARYRAWSYGRDSDITVVFAHEYGTFWRFTPMEWWRFVTAVIDANGSYDLPLSKALAARPRQIKRRDDGEFYSIDAKVRCVKLLDRSLTQWKSELSREVFP